VYHNGQRVAYLPNFENQTDFSVNGKGANILGFDKQDQTHIVILQDGKVSVQSQFKIADGGGTSSASRRSGYCWTGTDRWPSYT
jgi:hypothetical protein